MPGHPVQIALHYMNLTSAEPTGLMGQRLTWISSGRCGRCVPSKVQKVQTMALTPSALRSPPPPHTPAHYNEANSMHQQAGTDPIHRPLCSNPPLHASDHACVPLVMPTHAAGAASTGFESCSCRPCYMARASNSYIIRSRTRSRSLQGPQALDPERAGEGGAMAGRWRAAGGEGPARLPLLRRHRQGAKGICDGLGGHAGGRGLEHRVSGLRWRRAVCARSGVRCQQSLPTPALSAPSTRLM